MRVLCALLLVAGVAGAQESKPGPKPLPKKLTAQEVLKVLDPNGPHAPFRIISRDSITVATIPINAVLVVGEFSVNGDTPFHNHFVLKTLGESPATAESVAAWLAAVKVGQEESVSLQRFKKVREKRFNLVGDRATVKVRSNAEAAKDMVTFQEDKVAGTTVGRTRDQSWQVSLHSVSGKGTPPVLILNARMCSLGSRYLNVETVQVSIDGNTVTIPIGDDDRLQHYDRAPCEDVAVDVSDNFPLHMLLASVDGTEPITVRFNGDKERRDSELEARRTLGLPAILTTYYADRFGK